MLPWILLVPAVPLAMIVWTVVQAVRRAWAKTHKSPTE